eukprot:TRINITY_DN4541_c0_g1_i2.p1 TRINITY_DN4541_c0_g1~~TRINITY_DN4541_c0_g1_i2.p1  ORF type:complete len:379 (+),score=131.66 TRINITY_DN4541_c0_g1_i2:54-1190(+)
MPDTTTNVFIAISFFFFTMQALQWLGQLNRGKEDLAALKPGAEAFDALLQFYLRSLPDEDEEGAAAPRRLDPGPTERSDGPWGFINKLCPGARVQPKTSVAINRFCRALVGNATTEDFFGQYGQDWFLYMNFFRYMRAVHGGRGLYVDLGANHAFQISNTVFFDLCLQWRGLCVEPNPQYHLSYRLFRTCRLVPNCVWSSPKSLVLELDGVYTRLKDKTEKHPARVHHRTRPTHTAQCLPLATLLQRHGLNRSQVISLVDMDLEGVELPVLASFPFDEWKIMFFVIEWTAPTATLKRIYAIMTAAGFRMYPGQLGMDVVFYHPRLVKVPLPKPALVPPHGGVSHSHPLLGKRRGMPLVKALLAALQETCSARAPPHPD